MFDRFISVLRKHAHTNGHAARLITWADYREFERWLAITPQAAVAVPEGRQYLAELEKSGICIVPAYWSTETCERARAEVDRVIEEYPKYVNGNAKADVRVYGANNGSDLIQEFAQDAMLLEVASAYNREPTRTAFTLAARMPASAVNKGSGEGWHRDAFLRQVKAILYLTDVEPENGPFQWIRDSHRRAELLQDMRNSRLGYKQYRLTEEEVADLLRPQPGREMTFTAQAGTLILVDTSTVHRGMPIRAGTRYALTNYYFPEDRIDQGLYEKFDVLPAAEAI
jgi:ectoine hydroxylase-related dioxygenase (phytanoyl-CoA dioxygenase family)